MNANRFYYIDCLKGFLVSLVIFFHVFILIPNELKNSISLYKLLSDFMDIFLLYRMPILFLVCGFFCRVFENNFIIFFSKKIKKIIYPYFIWSFIYTLFFSFLGFAGYKFIEIKFNLIKLIFGQMEVTWFLYFLFIFSILVGFLKNINIKILFLFFLLINYLLNNVFILPFYNSLYWGDISFYLLFFLSGFLFFKYFNRIEENIFLFKFKFLSFCFFIIVILIRLNSNFFKTDLIYFFCVIFSLPFLVNFVMYLDRKSFRFFSRIGKNSIIYYLTHSLFIVLFFNFFKINNFNCLFMLIFGFLGPYLIYLFCNKYKSIGFVLFKYYIK